MKNKFLLAAGVALTLGACSGGSNDGCTYTPLLGTVGSCDDLVDNGTTTGTDNGTGATAKLLTGDYTATRIEYDAAADQLIIESLPFDDDVYEGRYDRVPTFDVTGYQAYRATKGLDHYIAYYGTSSTGNVSSAVVAQDGYADHGHAGAGYARNGSVTLPSTTQRAFYTGSYVGLRTIDDNGDFLDIITGDALMEADFSDGKLRGFITNRAFRNQQSTASVGTSMTLIEGSIDRSEAIVSDGTVGGNVDGTDVEGTWQALFGGTTGSEVAGVVVITHDDYRETGSFVAEQ